MYVERDTGQILHPCAGQVGERQSESANEWWTMMKGGGGVAGDMSGGSISQRTGADGGSQQLPVKTCCNAY